jgi:DNA-binding Lrp family transcriptional regulator
MHAYVFIECTPGNPILVADELRRVPGVEKAHAVTGAYDVIAFVQAENLAVLGELISARIHRLPGVLKTTTNVVLEADIPTGATKPARGGRA